MAEKSRTPAAKDRPSYAITSVDNALQLAAMMQLEGAMTVSQAAERLEVAPSTAHRLLRMLVYRGFAVQEEDRAYGPGPVLQLAAHSHSSTAALREVSLPHLASLAGELNETTNLAVRLGDEMRFIASAEGRRTLRISSREGMVFPAHRTAAGLQLLAAMEDDELRALYAAERFAAEDRELPDITRLRRELAGVRRTGLALNREQSEAGIVALAVAVRGHHDLVVAGLAVSIPASRFDNREVGRLHAAMSRAAAAIHLGILRREGTEV